MATYTIEALDTGGTVVATATVTATGTTNLGSVSSLFPTLPAGDYTFRAITPGTGEYTVQAATSLAPTYAFSGFDGGTFFATAEDENDVSLDLYFTIDQQVLADDPTVSQLVAGQDQTGATAAFSQGPNTVSTGLVELDLDISGLAEGDYVLRSVAKNSSNLYSPIVKEEILVDIPFVFDFTRPDGLLSAETGWSQGDNPADSGELRIVSNELVFDPEGNNGRCHVVTDAIKPENQYIEFTPSDLTQGTFNQFIDFRIRCAADGTGGHLLRFEPTEGSQGEIGLFSLSSGDQIKTGRPKIGSTYRFQHENGVVSLLEDGVTILSGADTVVTGSGQASIRFFFAESVSSFAIDGNFTFGAL